MAMIDELLFIKKFRETKAEKEFQKARQALLVADKAQELASQELQSFQWQAEQSEQAWYRDLCSKVVTVRDISHVQEDVAMLRQTEQDYVQRLRKAEQQHVQAKDHQVLANTRMREATKAREKFTELARNHHGIVAKEAERKEELELEEVSGKGRKNDDWSPQSHD